MDNSVAVMPATPIPERKKCGAPTTYKPEYADLIVQWFVALAADREPERIVKSEGATTSWHLAPKRIPTMVGFAAYIGTTRKTLHDWAKRQPAFGDAFARAREIEEDVIGQEAARGLIPPNIAIMLGQSYTDSLRNKAEIEMTSSSDSQSMQNMREALTIATPDELAMISGFFAKLEERRSAVNPVT